MMELPAARPACQGVNYKLFDLYEASVIIFLAARFEMVVICNNRNKESGMRNSLTPPLRPEVSARHFRSKTDGTMV